MTRLLGLVLARSGSRRVLDKNVRPFAGSSLIERAVAGALAARGLDAVGFSTDSPRYLDLVRRAGLDETYLRPAALARDDTSSAATVLDYLAWRADRDGVPFTHVVLLQPTSPFRTAAHIDAAVAEWRTSGSTSLVSVRPAQPHAGLLLFRHGDGRLVRHPADGPEAFVLDGALYITPVGMLEASGRFWDQDSTLFVTPMSCPWDVDTEADFALAEHLAAAETAP